MTEFERLKAKAESKWWAIPAAGDVSGETAWIRYWKAKEREETHPKEGRPVPPHRT